MYHVHVDRAIICSLLFNTQELCFQNLHQGHCTELNSVSVTAWFKCRWPDHFFFHKSKFTEFFITPTHLKPDEILVPNERPLFLIIILKFGVPNHYGSKDIIKNTVELLEFFGNQILLAMDCAPWNQEVEQPSGEWWRNRRHAAPLHIKIVAVLLF